MLTSIEIRHFAIVEHATLSLERGMTALTGETGAGKSILVDALGLALGDRADSNVIRQDADRAEISLTVEINKLPAAQAWLQQNDLDDDGLCIIRRVITREGRSRGYINGRASTMQALKELGEMLVDIHGQHAHQSLLQRDIQRVLLDEHAGLSEQLSSLAKLFSQWKDKTAHLQQLRSDTSDRLQRLDMLRYQVQELKETDLQENEWNTLNSEHNRLAHASELKQSTEQALNLLYEVDQGSVQQNLETLAGDLTRHSALDAGLKPVVDLLNEAAIQVNEAVNELRHYNDQLEMDPSRLQWLDQRLGVIHELARKHHCKPDQLLLRQQQLTTELDEINQGDATLERLESEISELEQAYDKLARTIGQSRRKAGRSFSKAVTAELRQLGMPDAKFEIAIDELDPPQRTAHGTQTIEFQVCANPGQSLQAISRVASGGELSRISLAIQVIAADNTHIPTLIYDEVDSGIGGAIAEVVGRRLRSLGKSHQVLCVTHLPQVASMAHQHLQVSKSSKDKQTRTRIHSLDHDNRIDEIARMLGGMEITAQSRAHAREMIALAEN